MTTPVHATAAPAARSTAASIRMSLAFMKTSSSSAVLRNICENSENRKSVKRGASFILTGQELSSGPLRQEFSCFLALLQSYLETDPSGTESRK